MNIPSICIPFIIGIITVAYPILLQAISRLDEKYDLLKINELFNKEPEKKYFSISLILSLLAIFIYILIIPPLIRINGLNHIIENSAIIILFISTLLLITAFLCLIKKIILYYSPLKFIDYLIKNDKKSSDNNYENFRAISDILYISIKQQNETLGRTISDYLYQAFLIERKKKHNEPVDYPFVYYEVVLKSTEELAILKSKKLDFLKAYTVGGRYFLGDLRDVQLSEQTYTWIWRNILLAIKYEQDDMIIYYWENAHDYYLNNSTLLSPSLRLNKSDKDREIAYKKEDDSQQRFREFHFALGGLLLYKN